MDKQRKIRDRLRRMAEDVILTADSVESALENNPNLQSLHATNALDPEAWQVAREHARKIVKAIDTGSHIEPEWINRIRPALTEVLAAKPVR